MEETKRKITRPPIVAVLGHVDHGKTTLLDAIRKTNIASREAGGITQSIGASVVKTKKGKEITFIDTPGHAAFENMRSRGAGASDIVLLVVAAEDGVKPQTIEAIKHINKTSVPFIVVLTKIDLASADPERALEELEKQQILFEGRGGNTSWLKVSGKTGEGVEALLETISLLAEVSEISADPKGNLNGVVIETIKSKAGPLVSCVIKNGSINVGDIVNAGSVSAKVRGLFDYNSKSVESILPGYPCQILGFSQLPEMGSVITLSDHGILGKESINVIRNTDGDTTNSKFSIIVKANSTGSLEAVLAGIPKDICTAFSGVGDVTESDVLMAKDSKAKIIVFEAKVGSGVAKLAENEGVKIEKFDIIYKLFERLTELLKEGEVEVLGRAEVVAVFPFNNKQIAGCKVTEGIINKTDKLSLIRDGKEPVEVKVLSLKKQKQDIGSAKKDEECGILFEPQFDFSVGDVLLSLRK